MDAADNLIYNPGTRELVQNDSQWHPGFPTLDSVPGTLPTGTVAPALLQTAVQAPLATIADQDLLAEDEAEVEDETDEDMDEIDDIDDDFDEDAVDDAEDTLLTAYAEAFANQPTLQPYVPDQHPYLPEVEYSMSDDQLSSEAEASDLPDLEEVLEPHETDQQTVDGSECYTIMPLNVLILYTAAEEDNTEVQSSALQEERNRRSTTTHPKTPFPFAKLPFNLLQTDQSDICLFLDIPYNTDPKSITTPSSRIPSSQVFCRQALNQKLAPGFAYLAQLERLNMMAQIPDLGLVLIGNQVGRVGVLTMTRCQAQCQSGFKIEAILPFKNEEDRGLRPTKPLMGMAVGPVQGMERALPGASPRLWGEGEREARRFRLLMMYCDHTVLSYEISRPEGGEDVLVV